MIAVSQEEYAGRVQKLQRHLQEKEIDLAILNYNSDLYYYSGSVEPLYLIVPGKGQPLLLARKAIRRIRDEVPHVPLAPFFGTKDLAAIIADHGYAPAKTIAMTLSSATYATVLRWQQLFGGANLADLSMDVRFIRMAKSGAELVIQREAGAIMAAVPDLVRNGFRPGMTELQLSALIENYFRLNHHGILMRSRREGVELAYGVCSAGTNTLAGTKFDGICSGRGVSNAMPYGANADVIPRGVPILLDYGFNLEGYHMDQTRMFCWGEPAPEVRRAYEAMLKVEELIMENLKPRKLCSEIYQLALESAIESGYEKEFMGLGPEKVRFVGHGVGLELDEPPFLAPNNDYPLEAGMVVAVEPKVSLPDIGVVGIEDSMAVRNGKPELLTKAGRELFVL